MNAILKGGLHLDIGGFDCKDISDSLTLTIRDYNSGDKISKEYFEIHNGNLIIPRFFPIDKYGIEEVIDKRIEPESIDITDSIEYRDNFQFEAVNIMKQNECAVIQAKPGFGKTIVSCKFISETGLKTLIMTHKKGLQEQWINELISHTSITVDDIGILGKTKMDELKSKKIILSTVQMMCQKIKNDMDYIDSVNTFGIGVILWDECHITGGGEFFSKASLFLNTRKSIGLSATPIKEAKLKKIISYHLGDIHEVGDSYQISPHIYTLNYNSQLSSGKKKWIFWGGRFNKARYYKQISNVDSYYQIWSKYIQNAIDKDRNILVLADRHSILERIITAVDLSSLSHVLYKSGCKEIKTVDDLKNYKVIFTTYQMFRDGFNIPTLDSLFMLTHNNNIEQSVGRLLRSKEGKKSPIVIDMVDLDFKDHETLYKSRLHKYLERGWKVSEINLAEKVS